MTVLQQGGLVFEKDRKRTKYHEVCLFLWKLIKGVM
jgi:hypothetical protein